MSKLDDLTPKQREFYDLVASAGDVILMAIISRSLDVESALEGVDAIHRDLRRKVEFIYGELEKENEQEKPDCL